MFKKEGIDVEKSYLAAIRNAEGSRMFSELYLDRDGESIDVLEDGRLSCAVFVTSLLYIFGLIDKTHATVSSTEQDLLVSGWELVTELKPGAIIIWERDDSPDPQRHIGFCLDEKYGMSTSSEKSCVVKHNISYRPVQAIYSYSKFE